MNTRTGFADIAGVGSTVDSCAVDSSTVYSCAAVNRATASSTVVSLAVAEKRK